MPSSLLIDANVTIAIVAVAIAGMVKAWVTLRQKHTHEKWKTHRFDKAIEGSSPQQRPEIIRSFGMLEEKPADEPAPDETGVDETAKPEKQSLFAWLIRNLRNPPSTRN